MDENALHELTAAYALDALDRAEADAYENHLAHCEQCREELAVFAGSAGRLAYAVPPLDPPAHLRERILVAARAERPNVVPLLAPQRSRFGRGLAAVAAVAACTAIGLGIWNVALHNRLDRAQVALRSVPLQGANGSVVVGPGGKGVLTVSNLPPAPPGKSYEVWVIDGGAASPAGVFRGGGQNLVVRLIRPVPRGAVVAVTVERTGGVEQPTTKPFIVTPPLV